MSSETCGGERTGFPLSMEAVVSDVSLSDLLADLALLLTSPEQFDALHEIAVLCEKLAEEPSTITILDSKDEKVCVISGHDADKIIELAVEQFVIQALKGFSNGSTQL
jgi:hypothetical protein